MLITHLKTEKSLKNKLTNIENGVAIKFRYKSIRSNF